MRHSISVGALALCAGCQAPLGEVETFDIHAVCDDPLLGYSDETQPFGVIVPLDIDVGGITAAVLDPFPVTTTCQTVIVGAQVALPTPAPPTITIATFDTLTPESPTGVAAYADVTLDPTAATPTAVDGILEYRIPLVTTHQAHLVPFVGSVVNPLFLIGELPECDPARGMRYRANAPYKGWSQLSEPIPNVPLSGIHAALYYGLADCGAD